jgi:hypothetical protein
MVNGQRSKVNGQRSMVKGQLSIVNYQLKKNSAYPVDKQGSVFLFSQINSIFSQKARCYFLISEIVFLASETTT